MFSLDGWFRKLSVNFNFFGEDRQTVDYIVRCVLSKTKNLEKSTVNAVILIGYRCMTWPSVLKMLLLWNQFRRHF